MYDKPRKILILEDDPIIAHDLAIILQQNGDYIHPICHSAHDAYDLIGKHEIDLAILDINLGSGPSGIDVATIINEKKLFPYIFLTSYSDSITLQTAQEQGPYGYLVKPFQQATLITTISVAINNFRNKNNGIDWSKLSIKTTAQEQKICEKLSEGLTYQECAEALYVSINTVRYHVKNLYVKFDVNSKSALISRLLS